MASKTVYEFPSQEGPVRVEVDEPPQPGQRPVARGDGMVQEAAQSFEQVTAGIRPIAEIVLAQITGLAQAPQSVEVSFGIKLSGQLGVILASTTAEGNISVKLVWERGKSPG